MIATSALPIVLPSVQIGDSMYEDGGMKHLIPVNEVKEWLKLPGKKTIDVMKRIKQIGKYEINKENLEKINLNFLSSRLDENEVLNVIKTIYQKFDIVLDPHSAIGYGAFDKVNIKGNNIVLATAHPCKFPEAIEKAINLKVELPKEIAFVLNEKENYDIVENNLNSIKQHIKERV